MGCAHHEEKPTGLVVLGSAEYDFGRHRQGEVLTHEFSLTNHFPTPVKIVGLRTSCGCLVAGKIEETIPPGASVTLPIRFTTGGVQETASGIIVVDYRKAGDKEDVGQPEYISLRVRADIIPDYRIEPREIDFGVIDGMAKQRVTRLLRVTPEAAASVKIHKVHSSNSFLQARIVPKEARDNSVQIEVSFDARRFTRSRQFNGDVVLSTDSKRVAEALVPVRGEYKAPAQIDPKEIVISSNRRGEVGCELRVTTSCLARIKNARCTADKGARIEFNSTLRAKEHVVRLFLAPCPKKSFDGELQVEVLLFTEGKENTVRTVRVPVHRFTQKGVENE